MFADPAANIAQLQLATNEVVADFGAGGGAYTIAAAQALKGTGRVYAIEVQKELLTRIQNTARDQHLGNVDIIWGDFEKRGGAKLHDGTVDVVRDRFPAVRVIESISGSGTPTRPSMYSNVSRSRPRFGPASRSRCPSWRWCYG